MDIEEYRKRGKEMVDYIADYLENIRDRRVFPNVKPGYMRNLVPDEAPLDGEEFSKIFEDVERVIMPGITHWQSPHMHAYFPALNSFPSLLGDMLADAINCLGFTWASSPACTELETIVMNWLGKMVGLPDEFLHLSKESKGGGVIQTTASESTLVCLLAGRTQGIKRYHERAPGLQDSEVNAKLVAYCSDQAHSSVEKAALIGLVRMRYIEADENLSLRGEPLRQAILEDIEQGLVPFWVCATLGTTGACSFDNLKEIGVVCQEFKLWLHVDAAYAGSAFICPEFRIWLEGIKMADSIAFNPSKWLMVHFDCTAMWVRNSAALHRTFNVEPLYLKHENSGLAIDYMHWQIPLSKRFRALKLWFVIRNYGIKGLQKHIREGVRLAQKLEALILADCRFEVPAARHLGMVVFRIKGENELTEKLLKRLNNRGNLHAVPASLKGKYVIRFTVTSTRTSNEDILKDWNEIRFVTTELLTDLGVTVGERAKVSLKDTREKNEAFGSSLLLANSPMSPKIVNGSFAAIFDTDEFLAKAYAGIRISHQDSPAMRRRVRGILMSGKQFSLDSRMDLVVHNAKDINNGAIKEDVEEACEISTSVTTVDNEPKQMLQEVVRIHDEDTAKKKCAISPFPLSSNALPSFSYSSHTSSSCDDATCNSRTVQSINNFSDNDENKYGPSSCLLPLAFDVVCSSNSEKCVKDVLLSTNQSTTLNFNPYQLNVSPVPFGETTTPSPMASPTRTLSHYNSSLDIILENQSVSAFNQTNNQCLSERKYSLDTAYLNRCSYYNKYFDCYTFNKYSDNIKEREMSCRRFSAPTPIPSSSSMTTTTTTTGNTLCLGLSDPNICSNRLSMCKSPPNTLRIKEEEELAVPKDPLIAVIKPKVKPRSIVNLCFTPSIDKDKLIIDAKICHKCGCASSKL